MSSWEDEAVPVQQPQRKASAPTSWEDEAVPVEEGEPVGLPLYQQPGVRPTWERPIGQPKRLPWRERVARQDQGQMAIEQGIDKARGVKPGGPYIPALSYGYSWTKRVKKATLPDGTPTWERPGEGVWVSNEYAKSKGISLPKETQWKGGVWIDPSNNAILPDEDTIPEVSKLSEKGVKEMRRRSGEIMGNFNWGTTEEVKPLPKAARIASQPAQGLFAGTMPGLARQAISTVPNVTRAIGDMADEFGAHSLADHLWRRANQDEAYLGESGESKALQPQSVPESLLRVPGMMAGGAMLTPPQASMGAKGLTLPGNVTVSEKTLPTLFGIDSGINGYDRAKKEGASTGAAILQGAVTGTVTKKGLDMAGGLFKINSANLAAQIGAKVTEAVAGGTAQTIIENASAQALYGSNRSLWEGLGDKASMWGMIGMMHLPAERARINYDMASKRLAREVEANGYDATAKRVVGNYIDAMDAYDKKVTRSTRKALSDASMEMSAFDPFVQDAKAGVAAEQARAEEAKRAAEAKAQRKNVWEIIKQVPTSEEAGVAEPKPTTEEVPSAIQEPSAAPEVPRAPEPGRNIPEGGEGVRQGIEGEAAPGEGEAQEVPQEVEPVKFKVGGKDVELSDPDLVREHDWATQEHEEAKRAIEDTPMTRSDRAEAMAKEGERFAKVREDLAKRQEAKRQGKNILEGEEAPSGPEVAGLPREAGEGPGNRLESLMKGSPIEAKPKEMTKGQTVDFLGGQQIYERILKGLGLEPDATMPQIGDAVMSKIKSLGKTAKETSMRVYGKVKGISRSVADKIAGYLHDMLEGTRKSQLGSIGKVVKPPEKDVEKWLPEKIAPEAKSKEDFDAINKAVTENKPVMMVKPTGDFIGDYMKGVAERPELGSVEGVKYGKEKGIHFALRRQSIGMHLSDEIAAGRVWINAAKEFPIGDRIEARDYMDQIVAGLKPSTAGLSEGAKKYIETHKRLYDSFGRQFEEARNNKAFQPKRPWGKSSEMFVPRLAYEEVGARGAKGKAKKAALKTKGMSEYSRTFMAGTGETGKRYILSMGEGKDAYIMRDKEVIGEATQVSPAKDGEPAIYKIKGTDLKMTVGEATTREIMQHTDQKYVLDPLASILESTNDLANVNRTFGILEDMSEQGLVMPSKDAPEDWVPIDKLANFNGMSAPQGVADVLNSFGESIKAINRDDPDFLRKVRDTSRLFVQTAFVMPMIHGPNTLDHGFVGGGVSRFGRKSGYKAFHDAFMAATVASSRGEHSRQMQALDAVINPFGSDLLIKILNAGGKAMNMSPIRNGVLRTFGDAIKRSMKEQPKYWDNLSDSLGVNRNALLNAIDAVSDKVWMVDNIMRWTQYLDTANRMGLDINKPNEFKKAIQYVDEHGYVSYDIPNVGPAGKFGNWLQRSPELLFARYHYGAMKLLKNKVHDAIKAVNPSQYKTPEGRREAMMGADRIAALAAMSFVIYPALDWLMQKLTGDENMEFRKGGTSHLAGVNVSYRGGLKVEPSGLIPDVVRLRKTPGQAAQSFFTPAPHLRGAMALANGRDPYTGQKIYHPGYLWMAGQDLSTGEVKEAGKDVAKFAEDPLVMAARSLGPIGTVMDSLKDYPDEEEKSASDKIRRFMGYVAGGKHVDKLKGEKTEDAMIRDFLEAERQHNR